MCPLRPNLYERLTPGFTSVTAVKAPAPLASAVTTSRRELPVVVTAPARLFFPLTLFVKLPAFSLVLEASDRESSAGGGRDLAGGIAVKYRRRDNVDCRL